MQQLFAAPPKKLDLKELDINEEFSNLTDNDILGNLPSEIPEESLQNTDSSKDNVSVSLPKPATEEKPKPNE
jgi:hypothetical protein